MLDAHIARLKKFIIANETSAIAMESLHDILQCSYENARTAVCSVNHSVAEQVLLEKLQRDEIDKTLNNRFFTYFNTCDAADQVGGKLISTRFFMAPIATYIQYRTG